MAAVCGAVAKVAPYHPAGAEVGRPSGGCQGPDGGGEAAPPSGVARRQG
ncbi:hypothetical protein [Sorangium cellulosum]|uniref:Uncharacterized protein n=1 Tax=Sorangium cellulosum So0157-2 TaxID=1254432 RepID=S4Y5A6_SORCE|nr:hypothetical protein [Sorangium cellulosum]AGP38098.1 hypothetical protein SCE1572_28680 [Sorangium cellulosum So0157-2]